MDQTTTAVNEHRRALGREPLESADERELLLVEACAAYGADRWEPGVLDDVLARLLLDEEIIEMIAKGDPDAEHDDLRDPGCAFAGAWREAERRGLLSR